jgi:hypothetical protein
MIPKVPSVAKLPLVLKVPLVVKQPVVNYIFNKKYLTKLKKK